VCTKKGLKLKNLLKSSTMKIKRPGNEHEETNRSVGIVKGDSK
jgi:hypothetical protein